MNSEEENNSKYINTPFYLAPALSGIFNWIIKGEVGFFFTGLLIYLDGLIVMIISFVLGPLIVWVILRFKPEEERYKNYENSFHDSIQKGYPYIIWTLALVFLMNPFSYEGFRKFAIHFIEETTY
jgi:hypothetical protein